MKRYLLFALCYLLFVPAARGEIIATPRGTPVAALTGRISANKSDYMTPATFNQMAPFMTSQMRERLAPAGVDTAPDNTSVWNRDVRTINVTPAADYVKDNHNAQGRQVVARAGTTNAARSATASGATNASPNAARAATTGTQAGAGAARAATPQSGQRAGGGQRSEQNRQVVARATRGDNTIYSRNAAVANAQNYSQVSVTSEQCLADYAACMDQYCERKNTKYNRCYCSPKLAQIDGQYQPAIDDILRRIVIIQNGGPGDMTDEEIEEFWEETFGGGGWGNSMASLNEALGQINWADAESRVRGQNAFVTGHEYCMRNLSGCFYMAENLKGVYRSEIAKDCAVYERYMNQLKTIAESTLRQLGG